MAIATGRIRRYFASWRSPRGGSGAFAICTNRPEADEALPYPAAICHEANQALCGLMAIALEADQALCGPIVIA